MTQVLRGQGADPRVPERRRAAGERLLPDGQAHVRVLQHLERRRLGHARRAGEDGLEQGALRLLLPRLRRRLLRLPRRGLRRAAGVRDGGQVVGPAARVGARRRAAQGRRLGRPEPRHLRLLRRPQAVPPATGGVQAPGRGVVSVLSVVRGAGSLAKDDSLLCVCNWLLFL
jgi:hypothetical protein